MSVITPSTGPDNISKAIEQLELDGAQALAPEKDYVRELNGRHAVVPVGGSTVILTESEGPDENNPGNTRINLTFGSQTDLRLLYKNRRDWVIDPATGKLKHRSIADIWLESPRRRDYRGIEFSPDDGRPGFYNLFRGF